MISQTEENYLKALFLLGNETGETTVNELSKKLNVKMPTANSMVKRLAEKGFAQYQQYKPIKLTDKGRIEASLIIRKHRLTEMYLVEKMNFGWEDVHSIAEQIEHIKSPAFFDKMDELLGYPKIDPHGSPIPDANGGAILSEYHKLSTCKQGDTVIFKAVSNSSDDFLKLLNNHGLRLGTNIKIEYVEPFDGSMHVSYSDKISEVLSSKVCERIRIEHLK